MQRLSARVLLPAFLFAATAPFASAQGSYSCNNPAPGPDIIVGSINAICAWGSVSSTSGYSVGATSCNFGDAPMLFAGNSVHHPVIAQNMYRYENGRFVQLGQSWVKHGFASATENLCCNCQDPGNPQMIGVGCADTYLSCQNGNQAPIMFGGAIVSGLGPRSEVNPTTGVFPWPYSTFGQTGDAIYKRLQVQTADFNPNAHPTARYFAEVHYVSQDEPSVDRTHNNASHREVVVGTFGGGAWGLDLTGPTHQMSPAILAWQDLDPGVMIHSIEDSAGGRFYLASRATDNGNGTWNYEYALYNMNSNQPANRVRVPVGPGVTLTNVGFKDVDSHSGEPYDTTDWSSGTLPGTIAWSTGDSGTSNAVRWGTLYNYWFTADVEPSPATIRVDLLSSGNDELLSLDGVAPAGPSCGASNFCLSLPNSIGLNTTIGFSGSTSFLANDLTLTAIGSTPSSFGLFYYGQNQVMVSFGDGFRCVAGVTFRLGPPQNSDAFGTAERNLDYTVAPMNSGLGMIVPGDTWNFQYWYRDSSGATGFNLSDGLSVVFCP